MSSPLDQLPMTPIEGAKPSTDGLPHATHKGILKLGDDELKVYQLSNGERVVDAEDFTRFLMGEDDQS